MKNTLLVSMLLIIGAHQAWCQNSTFKTNTATTTIESQPIKTAINVIQTAVQIKNKTTNEVLPKFYYTFTSESKTDIIKDLKSNTNSVSGIFTVEVDGQVLYRRKVAKGVMYDREIFHICPQHWKKKSVRVPLRGNFSVSMTN